LCVRLAVRGIGCSSLLPTFHQKSLRCRAFSAKKRRRRRSPCVRAQSSSGDLQLSTLLPLSVSRLPPAAYRLPPNLPRPTNHLSVCPSRVRRVLVISRLTFAPRLDANRASAIGGGWWLARGFWPFICLVCSAHDLGAGHVFT